MGTFDKFKNYIPHFFIFCINFIMCQLNIVPTIFFNKFFLNLLDSGMTHGMANTNDI